MRLATIPSAVLLAGCAAASAADAPVAPLPYTPPPGVNLVLEGPIEGAQGRHLVMGDLLLGPHGEVPRHIHSGEEFLFVLAGSATIIRDGMPDLTIGPGEGVRIAPGLPHSGLAGPEGVRAVASWVVVDGQPLRSPAPE